MTLNLPELPEKEANINPELKKKELSESLFYDTHRVFSDKISIVLIIMFILTALLGSFVSMALWSSFWKSQLPSQYTAPGPSDKRIVSGMRTGFITLGMNPALLEEQLGQYIIRPQKNSVIYLFEKKGITVSILDGRVSSVFCTNPEYAVSLHDKNNEDNSEFLSVGSSVDSAIRTFGNRYDSDQSDDPSKNKNKYVIHYWPQGIHFGVSENKITYIMITENILENDDLAIQE